MIIFFFLNDTATTQIYTLSLHDALPILQNWTTVVKVGVIVVLSTVLLTLGHHAKDLVPAMAATQHGAGLFRSEEHTSELQSHSDLVCRLLLEKKKEKKNLVHGLQRDVAE